MEWIGFVSLLLHFLDVSNFGNSAVGGFEQMEAVDFGNIHSPQRARYGCTSLVMLLRKAFCVVLTGYALLMFWGIMVRPTTTTPSRQSELSVSVMPQ